MKEKEVICESNLHEDEKNLTPIDTKMKVLKSYENDGREKIENPFLPFQFSLQS